MQTRIMFKEHSRDVSAVGQLRQSWHAHAGAELNECIPSPAANACLVQVSGCRHQGMAMTHWCEHVSRACAHAAAKTSQKERMRSGEKRAHVRKDKPPIHKKKSLCARKRGNSCDRDRATIMSIWIQHDRVEIHTDVWTQFWQKTKKDDRQKEKEAGDRKKRVHHQSCCLTALEAIRAGKVGPTLIQHRLHPPGLPHCALGPCCSAHHK